jgi:5'-nucleotidase
VLAAYLTEWEHEAATQGISTLRVGAGDLIGASPPISSLLKDEPTIQMLSQMGLQYSAVGNHELDKGVAELLRLQHGVCGPSPGMSCFPGAGFQYLAANVVSAENAQPILPPYAIVQVQGIPIGFIGVVLKETATMVIPTGVAEVSFLDEAAIVNRYVAELRTQGVETIVVLIHQGGRGTLYGDVQGVIVPIVEAMDDAVDVVVSGHTHRGYQGMVGGKLVTQAFANGTAFADIDLTIDRQTRDVTSKAARIVSTWADVAPGTTPDPAIAALVAEAEQLVRPLTERVVGTAAAAITRSQNAAGESALGNLIADAQRTSMGTQLAFTNPGAIRTNLAAGPVTWGALYAVQPFANELVSVDLTGAQIDTLLEEQWIDQSPPHLLQLSGLTYGWSPDAPVGSRVDPAHILIGGVPIDLTATYRVTVNSFLAEGGDNFTVLTEAVNSTVGPLDVDALVDYVAQLPQPFTAEVDGRVTQLTLAAED